MTNGSHYSNVGSFIVRAWADVLQSEMWAPFTYIYIWRWKRHARTAIWYMVPLFERGQFHISCMRICYEPLLNLGVTLYCTIIMYWADYWQFLLSCMSRCSFNWKCKHGSRIYIYMTMKKARAHIYMTYGSHYSNMGSFIFRACTYVWNVSTVHVRMCRMAEI